ncbi:hypothetical protein [Clostridium kluyveri]|uniref:Uncharacterized protein n=2 Tax=Clostridium kluyveri TaxID=1534 RepID=A5N8J1_CLOK5|nr:hypothetical protein [Clostridium kluyveri]EDK33622.1 Conserved hypothetical protein [Clostridium kluyveri DSM 555]BAH06521.1 hypothetical protein CKR_1470 [Clostridium kluyveri NBRC 12016]
MNKKQCIFNEKKACNNCNECNTCDLNPSKKCNNCGKCLELEGYDMKAIKIDTILDDEDESKEYQIGETEMMAYDRDQSDSYMEDMKENTVEFIDDIDGLREILDNKDKFKKIIHEEYPGLIKIIKDNK